MEQEQRKAIEIAEQRKRSAFSIPQQIMCDYQVDRIFSEKQSGANIDRPQLKAMLDYVCEGIEIAKAQGKYTGRKPIEIDRTKFGQLYGEWKSKSIKGRDFMRKMGFRLIRLPPCQEV